MELNLSYSQAAARQSWHRDSMRNLLIAMVEEHPNASDKDLLRLFTERMRDNEEYLMAAAEYAVMQTLSTLERRTKKARSPVEKAQAKAAVDGAVEKVKTQILLLNEVMPNGKRMRFCSGTEMQAMGAAAQKEGATWIKIGKKVGAKLVGQALTEKDVRAIIGR